MTQTCVNLILTQTCVKRERMNKSIADQLEQAYEEIVQIERDEDRLQREFGKALIETIRKNYCQACRDEAEFPPLTSSMTHFQWKEFQKIIKEEEIPVKLTETTLECTNDKCRCKERQKENEGLKT